MKSSIHSLIEIAEFLKGKVPLWVQGPGGNISFKTSDRLFIKASGQRIDDIKKKEDLAELQLSRLKKQLSLLIKQKKSDQQQAYDKLLTTAKVNPQSPHRASMETGFHALLTKSLVVHIHSVPAILMAHQYFLNPDKVGQWLKEKTQARFSFLDFVKPGWDLVPAIFSHKNSDLIFLQNHGLILQMDSVELLNHWLEVEKSFCQEFGYELLQHLFEIQNYDNLKILWNKPGPMKALFPDFSVYEEQFKQQLTITEDNLYQWSDPNTPISDLDEIWLSHLFLYYSEPQLTYLDANISQEIKKMPSEKYRQKMQEK